MLSISSDTRGEPRGKRIGGYTMSHDFVERWAMSLLGQDEMSREDATASVGEVSCVHCMIVTQWAKVKGVYVNTPASDIEQFEPNDFDEKVRNFLNEQGFVEKKDFNFETWLD